MNIESLLEKINLFERLVINSGFSRDIKDFIQAIQQEQNKNLVFMKDLSSRVQTYWTELESYDLNNEIDVVLKDNKPFMELDCKSKLEKLDSNTEIDAPTYFKTFNTILNQINQRIESNTQEINSVKAIFQKYTTEVGDIDFSEDQALVSLIFKDLKTTTSLKEFSKVLNRWNRTLLMYHTLLKSESPKEISLVEIQNGSIDVIFNIDFDVAIDLTELVKLGLKVYGAYLLYKSKRAKEIIDSYMGNRKLIKMEQEREKLMLDNIKESIANKILEQHKERLINNNKIEKPGSDKKIEEISTVLTDHIIKGNEIKLLTPPPIDDNEEVSDENKENISEELSKFTASVREQFNKLSVEDQKLLLDRYSIKDNNDNENK